MKHGVIDEHALKAAGGQMLEDGSGVRIAGWVVRSGKAPITTDAECETLKDRLNILAMPEQFFGSNHLRLEHEASGCALDFTAMGALLGWLADCSSPVRVEAAADWQRSRAHEVQVHQAKTLEYDWTYTTPYLGDVLCPGTASRANGSGTRSTAVVASSSGTADGASTVCSPSHNNPTHPAAPAPEPLPGLTVSPGASDGSAAATTGAADTAEAGGSSGTGTGAPRWQECKEQVNRGLLMSRDPILYYDELVLYESELEDNGVSQVSLKVRVMPRCWLVLLRFFLRVDKVLVRLREARFFCQVKHHEGGFAELRESGAPPEGPAYADGDSAAAALMAVAPVGVKLYRNEKLVL